MWVSRCGLMARISWIVFVVWKRHGSRRSEHNSRPASMCGCRLAWHCRPVDICSANRPMGGVKSSVRLLSATVGSMHAGATPPGSRYRGSRLFGQLGLSSLQRSHGWADYSGHSPSISPNTLRSCSVLLRITTVAAPDPSLCRGDGCVRTRRETGR